MKEFLLSLFGFAETQLAPIFVRTARIGAIAGVTAFGGAASTELGALDWGQYAVLSPFIVGGLSLVVEGTLDQLKANKTA